MRMLDLFAGRLGWSKEFLARGWEVVAVDWLSPPASVPESCRYVQYDIMRLYWSKEIGFYLSLHGKVPSVYLGHFDFACASSPCEEFSLFGMAHFHPNPPYPELGLELFNHTRKVLEMSGIRYIQENVRPAQKFVGYAVSHCGPFYLWGNAVPPLLPQGIKKGIQHAAGFSKSMSAQEKRLCRLNDTMLWSGSKSKVRIEHTAVAATIPPELASCVADYAERICKPE